MSLVPRSTTLDERPMPDDWTIDKDSNFMPRFPYSQTFTIDSIHLTRPPVTGEPVYGRGNDPILHCIQLANERGEECLGFFYQQHTNGHEICGFYSAHMWHSG